MVQKYFSLLIKKIRRCSSTGPAFPPGSSRLELTQPSPLKLTHARQFSLWLLICYLRCPMGLWVCDPGLSLQGPQDRSQRVPQENMGVPILSLDLTKWPLWGVMDTPLPHLILTADPGKPSQTHFLLRLSTQTRGQRWREWARGQMEREAAETSTT